MQGPITVDDDRDANELTVTERYLIDKQELAEGVEDHRWPLRADLLEDMLETPGAAKRRAPVDLPYPMFREHVVSITGEGVHMTALDHITVGNDYFHFSRESESRRGSFTADWSLEIKQPEVPAAGIKPYLRDAKDVDGFLWSTYDLSAVLGRGGVSSSKGMTSFAGATPDKPPTPQQLAEMTKRVLWPSAIFLSMSGLIFCAAIFNLRADRAYAQQGFYYPVSLDKFLALSLATWGTYTIFWLWKCNRWRNEFEGGRTWAFWRALFYPFWLFPMFRAANRRNERAPLPRWLGVGAAILSAALYFASFGVNMAFVGSGKAFAVALLLAVLQTACAVPAVLAVNRLHRPGNIALVQNSKYNAWNIVGIVVGIATVFALLLLPRFAAAG
ncbi:hypothetical protein D3874_16575 [Oleomonas cavernae]|uniref:Uncharacterized protein n=1 Tax=Oleomonas cavernae TaxID=2320859 RepID=A0A418WEL5_9PROT|nr:hypothetical protein [Oleomonas cavernae]RJF88430.1 hypothetical protein D3874_16575 [Oleomonas cavernae]